MSSNFFSNKNNEDLIKKLDVQLKAVFSVLERQKQLESSLDSINEKLELIDHTIYEVEDRYDKIIKSLREDINEMKKDIENLKNFSMKIKKELTLVARKDEVQVLKKYIDLWEPLNFATKEDLENFKKEIIEIIKDVLGDE